MDVGVQCDLLTDRPPGPPGWPWPFPEPRPEAWLGSGLAGSLQEAPKAPYPWFPPMFPYAWPGAMCGTKLLDASKH